MKINLGLHLGFAITRYNDPKIWTKLVKNEFGLNHVQFVSDLINPEINNIAEIIFNTFSKGIHNKQGRAKYKNKGKENYTQHDIKKAEAADAFF